MARAARGGVFAFCSGTGVNRRGDLRFYAAVQAYAVMVLLLVLFLPAQYSRSSDLGVGRSLRVAKLLETSRLQIFGAGHIVSGHTPKHVAAGYAAWILRMLEKRDRCSVRRKRGRRYNYLRRLEDGELEPGLGGNSSATFLRRWPSRMAPAVVIALAQIAVVHIEIQRQQMEIASEKADAKNSLSLSVSGPEPVAAFRASQASMEVSPRTSASTCFHDRSAKACDTPVLSTMAWPTLI